MGSATLSVSAHYSVFRENERRCGVAIDKQGGALHCLMQTVQPHGVLRQDRLLLVVRQIFRILHIADRCEVDWPCVVTIEEDAVKLHSNCKYV